MNAVVSYNGKEFETAYGDIFMLKEMLEAAEIPFIFHTNSHGHATVFADYEHTEWQLEYPRLMGQVCVVSQGPWTPGWEHGLMGVMGLLTEAEKKQQDKAYLTTDEIYNRICEHYERTFAKFEK